MKSIKFRSSKYKNLLASRQTHSVLIVCLKLLFMFVHFFYHNLLDQTELMRRDICCLYSTSVQLTKFVGARAKCCEVQGSEVKR
jgi:hypothetical protein